jgi:hypothetical protein
MLEMLLDSGGINWCIYHKVMVEGDDMWEGETFRLHKGRDAEAISKQASKGYIEHINPTAEYRKRIGLGEGEIVRVRFYDNDKPRYYRWHRRSS